MKTLYSGCVFVLFCFAFVFVAFAVSASRLWTVLWCYLGGSQSPLCLSSVLRTGCTGSLSLMASRRVCTKLYQAAGRMGRGMHWEWGRRTAGERAAERSCTSSKSRRPRCLSLVCTCRQSAGCVRRARLWTQRPAPAARGHLRFFVSPYFQKLTEADTDGVPLGFSFFFFFVFVFWLVVGGRVSACTIPCYHSLSVSLSLTYIYKTG